ncbi:MAG: serine/threonine-protein kinase [Gemmatimonadota bacterium]|nr:serine/threonine-protein kinase [Gemmatimonadota bacterium]
MPETLVLPKTLNGRYAVERELGSGQAMVVYVARDLTAGRRVALRVLRPELAADQGAERFLQQVPVVARLEHPNILAIVDAGRSGGAAGDEIVYCVSPYIEGGNLRRRLEREPQLPLDEALRIAGGVAAALDLAHRHHIAHQHITPENILLCSGEPLVDFGIGERLAGSTRDLAPDPEVAIRAVAYMSPELLRGQPVDGRTDQYSLAAVLYEMLTGKPPFVGPTPDVIFTRALTEPPPRLTAVRVVPRIVERAIHRALSKSPADRFRTVGEFAAALHGAAVAPPAATPTPAHARRRWRVPLISSLVVLATGAGVAMASRAVVSRRPATTVAHNQLTFTGTATSPALLPGGRSVLYIAGGRSLVLQSLDRGSPLALVPSAASISAARWTGDAKAILVAMTRDSTERPATFLVPTTGGSARKVLDDARPFDSGPDSTVIVRAPREGGRIEIVSLASGEATRTIPLPDSIGAVGEVAWSPDRRWIAFTDASNGELWVVAAGCPPKAGGCGSPSHVAAGARTIRWASGSDALYFLSGPAGTVDLMRVGIDMRSGRSSGDAARVTSLLASDGFDIGPNRLVHTQTSRGAQLRAFVLGGAGTPWRVLEEQPLSEGTARLDGATISPDGRWVAYSAARGTERDIHVVAFGGGSARVVAASPALEDAPAWSPDGSRLTFAREDSTGRAVILADARTGSGRRVGSVPGPGSLGAAARWSASGRHIAYYAQDLRRIVLVNLQRRNESVIRLPENVGTGYVFVVPSPNGTQLIASTRVGPDDQTALWLVFGNGRRWRRIPGPFGEAFPIAWHRNGWIYLVRNRALATDHGAVHLELWRMRGPTGRPELFAALPEGCGLSVSISADASRGVCNYVRVESDLYVASNFGTSGR